MVLGPRMRERRTALGLSQEAVARKAGLSLNLVNKLENGVVTDPHYSTLVGLAGALGVAVDELVREPALMGKADASETGQDVWRAIAKEALGADPDEVLIPTTRITPALFPSVLEILEQEAHQLENLSIVIEGGYIKAGLRSSA